LQYPLEAVTTFALVLIGWVLFRAATVHDALYIIGQMFAGPPGMTLFPQWLLWLAGISLVLALLEEHLSCSEWLIEAPASD
jgi:D-alanyl-lipoteichoic acid acyltransferase DltB (MBOAT superfamily)